MDVSNASHYIQEIKVVEWGTPKKKYFKKMFLKPSTFQIVAMQWFMIEKVYVP